MTNLTKALSRIDPTEGFVAYVNTVKPYHSKILDVLLEYVYTDSVKTTVKEKWKLDMTFTRPKVNVVYSCGFGYRWDPAGITSPDSLTVGTITSATPQLSNAQSNSFVVQVQTPTPYSVIVTDAKSNQLAFTRALNIVATDPVAQTFTVSGDISSFEHFDVNSNIYVTDNTGAGTNGVYTVIGSSSDGTISVIYVQEPISLLATASGTAHFVLSFDEVPYWPSGTTISVASSGNLPTPLASGTEYHFIPGNDVGYFNLASTRYPSKWEDFIDLTTVGSGSLLITRTEPFVPGDSVRVTGSTNAWNDGPYSVKNVVKLSSNTFRVFVMQRVNKMTPVGVVVDGRLTLDLQAYNTPAYCDIAQAPDLHADTFITEKLMFSFDITFNESISTNVRHIENASSPIGGSLLTAGYDVQVYDLGGYSGIDGTNVGTISPPPVPAPVPPGPTTVSPPPPPPPKTDYPIFASSFAGTPGKKAWDSTVEVGPPWLATAFMPHDAALNYDTRMYWNQYQAAYWTVTTQGAAEIPYDYGYALGLPAMMPPTARTDAYYEAKFTIESLDNGDADSWYLTMIAAPYVLDSNNQVTIQQGNSNPPYLFFYMEFYPDSTSGLHFYYKLYSSDSNFSTSQLVGLEPTDGHQYLMRVDFKADRVTWIMTDLTSTVSVQVAEQMMPDLGFTVLADYQNSAWYCSYVEGTYATNSAGNGMSQNYEQTIVQYQHVEVGSRNSTGAVSIVPPSPDPQLSQHNVFYVTARAGYDQSIYASVDGQQWNKYQGPSYFVPRLLAYNSGLVAFSEGYHVATSPTGYGNWTEYPFAFNPTATIWQDQRFLSDWVLGPDKIVALTYKSGSPNQGTPYASYSTNGGATWTTTSLPIAAISTACITYGNGKYIIFGSDVNAFTSPDGINWSTIAVPAPQSSVSGNNRWYRAIYAGGQFVVLCNSGNFGNSNVQQIMTSPDGVTWTVRSVPASFPYGVIFMGLCYDSVHGQYIVTGAATLDTSYHSRTLILRSSDAVTWTDVTPSELAVVGTRLVYLTAAGNGKIMFMHGNTPYYSTDGGATWTSSTINLPFDSQTGIDDIVFAP